MPKFSVIIPCYNAAATLPDTLASLRAQTCPEWEAICIDDGSTDNTRAILRAAAQADPRIRWCPNPGKGPSAARNHGALHMAAGAVVAFLDADDLWVPERLARLNHAFADRSLAASYARIAFFRDRPRDATVFSTVPAGDLSVPRLLGENPVCTMSNIAVRRPVFAATGGFEETLVHNEDLEWLIRLVGCGHRVAAINAVLVHYRTSAAGLSADLGAMAQGRQAALATAGRLGFTPRRRDEAIHLRYLARRALRLQAGRLVALRLTLAGLRASPAGFLSDPRRGGLTALAALATPILPRRLSGALFAR
ncbi:glycosyltransferase family 2 protein [Rhodovulum adriaticum]|uniref:Glycosyltransferase involved in cell wall biosynthesis n=1 Tax=Rhodovulum adriaticum TaxID=35804 RepID=A0A4V2SMK1_RHOAD|nr:glycosyltransferase family 2 protein [Rhodovulum adriaticum]MBK1634800.1 glucosyl transferase [Rhodovulum adriaticum]TCP27626.1 glycosyltransferase involved in cell wall biosynthesis [Rhodovulum adriaticum]